MAGSRKAMQFNHLNEETEWFIHMPKATQLNNKKILDQRLLPLTYSKAEKQKSVESL